MTQDAKARIHSAVPTNPTSPTALKGFDRRTQSGNDRNANQTGPLSHLSRTEMTELITKTGGRASFSVSTSTHLVVAGENAGSKPTRAQALGIETITPEELAQRLTEHLT
ncbi:BRCT domain-containing protein [Micromonospora echinofusca]|uniref:BRCT domain-containing protein n=1 Tax=Micromonospora echinofusca TaxID=47858 RepID=A0ABS3VJW4_MICEH|nr:BRCT domain-containing protein [Micromonospora echinofusca]MBO4204794.1 hypothetical protein [Micromonospora echinofusca]